MPPPTRQESAPATWRVQVDDLHLREALEPPHPAKDVLVPDGEPLALHELYDRAAFEVDGGDQHGSGRKRGMTPFSMLEPNWYSMLL
jgi:hypothetical protein